MASQPAASFDSVEFNLFIRGYHAYKDIWELFVGEALLLKWEPTNVKDCSAVAVMKETKIVGHVPYNISSGLSMFLRWDCNKGFAEVIGNCVNQGAGYGMEVPCIYRLYGPTIYIQRFQQIIQSLQERELLWFKRENFCDLDWLYTICIMYAMHACIDCYALPTVH